MEYKRFGDKIVLRLDKGDEITESVISVAQKEGVSLAEISGIGATDDFTVGVFDMAKSVYDSFSYNGNHEITSLTGNITEMNGKTYQHIHITCAGKNGFVGGHLLRAKISLTAEIFINILSGKIDRRKDENLKINTLYFY